MKIIEPHTKVGWVTAIIEGRWVQAKVYDEPSDYGLASSQYPEGGRVSKLVISKTNTRDLNSNFFEQMCFNYDRGLDFDESPKGLVQKVVKALETLPLQHS